MLNCNMYLTEFSLVFSTLALTCYARTSTVATRLEASQQSAQFRPRYTERVVTAKLPMQHSTIFWKSCHVGMKPVSYMLLANHAEHHMAKAKNACLLKEGTALPFLHGSPTVVFSYGVNGRQVARGRETNPLQHRE